MFSSILSLFIVAQFASAAIDNQRNFLALLNFGQAHFNAKHALISISIQRAPDQTSSNSALPDDCQTLSSCYQSTGVSACPIQNTTREYYSIDSSRVFTRHTCPAGQIFDSSTCQCSCDPSFDQTDAVKPTRCQRANSTQFSEASSTDVTQFWTIEQDGCTYAFNVSFCPIEQQFVVDRCSCGCPSAPANESQTPCCDFDVNFASFDLQCQAANGQLMAQSSIDVSYYYELQNAANCTGAQRRKCPDNYFFSLGNCSCQILWPYPYYLLRNVARESCQSYGGDLFAPRSSGELAHMNIFFNKGRYSANVDGDFFWLGGIFEVNTGKWQFHDDMSDISDHLRPINPPDCSFDGCPSCLIGSSGGIRSQTCFYPWMNMPLCYGDFYVSVPTNPYDNKWFTTQGDFTSFEQLQQACVAANPTASVATLKSDDQIRSFLNYQWIVLLAERALIGLHKVDNEWQWSDGTLLSEQSWKLWNTRNKTGDNEGEGNCAVSISNWISVDCETLSENFYSTVACMLP